MMFQSSSTDLENTTAKNVRTAVLSSCSLNVHEFHAHPSNDSEYICFRICFCSTNGPLGQQMISYKTKHWLTVTWKVRMLWLWKLVIQMSPPPIVKSCFVEMRLETKTNWNQCQKFPNETANWNNNQKLLPKASDELKTTKNVSILALKSWTNWETEMFNTFQETSHVKSQKKHHSRNLLSFSGMKRYWLIGHLWIISKPMISA